MNAKPEIPAESPAHRSELRLWLRLLTTANTIEAEIRRRLRDQFDTTLPRFDLMAQLERAPDGIMLSELSRRMMVSNGNVTGIVDRLVADGLAERETMESDRRAFRVRISERGAQLMREMTARHLEWINELFAGVTEADAARGISIAAPIARLRAMRGSRHGAASSPPGCLSA